MTIFLVETCSRVGNKKRNN